MTASLVHIGIDLAWGPKNRTGLAAVAADGRLLASGSATTADEIVDWVGAYADRLGVVAIDAPLVVVNQTGRRGCESQIHEHFGRFDASPHSTNLGRPVMHPPRGAVIAERLGLPMDPTGPRERVAIEVYPHPAMVGLWQLDLILKYKHKTKYPFDFRKQEFGRLLDLLKSEPALRAAELPRWGELRSIAASATKHGDLNRIEDEVDGIVCAWLAWLWASTDARLEVYGDAASGYIVAPEPPTHEPRPRLHRVAPSRQVRFVGDARSSTPIVAEPEFTFDGPSRRWTLSIAEANELERMLVRLRADG
jgi:predicted RNase H-like nuclease